MARLKTNKKTEVATFYVKSDSSNVFSNEKLDEFYKVLNTFINNIKSLFDAHLLNLKTKNKLDLLAQKYAKHLLIFPSDYNVNVFDFKLNKKNVLSLCDLYSRGIKFKALSNRIKKLKFAEKTYINEAFRTFNNREYLACCLILLSIIDCEFLNRFHRSDGYKLVLSDNNLKAANSYSGVVDSSSHDFIYFYSKNLYLVLENCYKNADNFNIGDFCLNRNMLMHGVSKRKVSKNDCIKLMFALDSLYYFDK